MKNRDFYMSQLMDFKDREQVKVITGVRRCGKSTLLELFKKRLHDDGVTNDRIIHISFDTAEYDRLLDGRAMWEYIRERANKTIRTYILLDEVQLVSNWERYVNSLRIDCYSDIYITGSNASLLATRRSSILGGRCASVMMYPLSFKEYLDFNVIEDTDDPDVRQTLIDRKFGEYLQFGGMPTIAGAGMSDAAVKTTLLDIYDAVISRDVIEKNSVRDPTLLRAVAAYLSDNIGCISSPKKISDYLTSGGKKTTSETIDNYLSMLEDSFLFYGVKRYDLKGKQYLRTLGKYYIVDTGVRNALLGFNGSGATPVLGAGYPSGYGFALENIVYFELLRRNGSVAIGKQNGYEVDFVTDSFDDRKYYQVTATLMDAEMFQREMRPLEAIRDNYEKTILTMDNKRFITQPRNGIKIVNIIDFLLQP